MPAKAGIHDLPAEPPARQPRDPLHNKLDFLKFDRME
jgi:hypothetical protein